jgi:dTMP kinase
MLVDRLRERGVTVLVTHEPGGTHLGDQLRQLVLVRDDLQIVPRAEALLMNASRAQLVEQIIQPALERGEVVVSDRFADSTLAYQGSGRGLDTHDLNSVISFATAGLRPDMTMLLDLPVGVGLARKEAQPGWNRFEDEALMFHERVRTAYAALARAEPERWFCLDGLRPPEELAEDVWRVVAQKLGVAS